MKNKQIYQEIVEKEPYCQLCGSTSYLEIHHIYYRSQGGLTVPENLIRLCSKCHRLVHSNKKVYQSKLIEMQKEKCGEINIKDLIRSSRWKR